MSICPRCQQEIPEAAVVCPHCAHRLRQDAGPGPAAGPASDPNSALITQIQAIDGMLPPGYHVRPGYYLSAGWDLFRKNIPGFAGFTFFLFLVHFLLNFLGSLGFALNLLISAPLTAGLYIASAKLLRGFPTETNDFFGGLRYFLPLMLYGIVSSLLITAGFFLLILPGLYLVVGYTFTTLVIIDRKLDFWPAMELSRKLIHRQWFAMFGFLLLLLLVNLGGALLLGLGLLVTIPWSVCAITCAFNDIMGLRADSY